MATHEIKKTIDKHFGDNWVTTPIQLQGEELDTAGLDDFISLIYTPVENTPYGLDGTSTGRIEYNGLYRVFCYAKNPTKTFILADAVKAFLNGKQFGDISIEVGQDSGINDLKNGFYQTVCTFNLSEWS